LFTRTSRHREIVNVLQRQLEVAEALQRAAEARIERLTHDLERTHADLQQAVLLLGNMAQRPVGKTLFDEDIFREDSRLPDVFLSPDPDEFVSGEEILQELDGKRGD
jgi:hypothetical protein